MPGKQMELLVGGSADWGTPVRFDEATLKAQYEARMMARMAVAGSRAYYLKLRIVGVDDMDNEGEVPEGWGALEFQDTDGDWLRGQSSWYRADGEDRGAWTFSSGTGKWEHATGSAEMLLYYMPEDFTSDLPPEGPIRFFAFLEGSGEIEAPALGT